jgi:hypothetical protein
MGISYLIKKIILPLTYAYATLRSFPIWSPQQCSRGTKKRLARKNPEDKKNLFTNVLISFLHTCYLTIAGYGFFLGRLRVPTRHCDLVVPADWGWGCGN